MSREQNYTSTDSKMHEVNAFENAEIPKLPEDLTVKHAKYLSLINRLELQFVGQHYSEHDHAIKIAYGVSLKDFIVKYNSLEKSESSESV